MKKTLLTIALAISVQFSYAQWTNGTGDINNTNTGNIGIGNSTPDNLLTIGSSSIRGTVNVIGGTSTPTISLTDSRTGGHPYSFYSGLSALGNYDIFDQSAQKYRLTINSSGNVGIGTTTPGYALDIVGDIRNSGFFHNSSGSYWFLNGTTGAANINAGGLAISANYNITPPTNGLYVQGNIGISTNAPESKLHIQDGSVFIKTTRAGTNAEYSLISGTQAVNGVSGHAGVYLFEDGSAGFGQASGLSFKTSTNDAAPTTNLIIRGNGNVGIGTADPHGYKLAVNGSAIATSITVKNYTNWPDYVFNPKYKLPSLTDVKFYINKNQHLPDMPSEKEIKDNGIDLGKIVEIQTKKIEELTLYIIQQNERINKLEEQQKTDKIK